MSKRIIISIIIIALLITAGFFIFHANKEIPTEPPVIKQDPYRIEKINIEPDTTYSILMEQAGIDANLSAEILEAAKSTYDLAQIRVGRTLDLYFDKITNKLVQLVYQIDTEQELIVKKNETNWITEKKQILYEVKEKIVEGTLKTSLYEWALENNIDERAIIDFANALQWSIDFANDPQVGDTFKFIYQERYRDGQYIMPATMLAGKYINKDKKHLAFYFEENADNKGYFDADGNSLQKMFLKAPLEYKYISSGYTLGLRYIQAFNVSTGHKAVDYAATYGTPIRSVGNGTVISAGWYGGCGNRVSIRHNATYATNYCHLSKFAVKSGQKVTQGQVIGYVGSTGFSTGPHLHYEMVKNGAKVNPLLEILPPGKPIANENKERFFKAIEKYKGY